MHGSVDRAVTGVTVAWMATPDAIEAAGAAGHELFIAHESLHYPYGVLTSPNPPADWKEWKVNTQRRSLLDQHGLTLIRVHGTADEIIILDAFAEMLQMGEPVFADKLLKVYEIPPCPLHELVETVKRRMAMPHLRVAPAGDMNRIVHRVGLPWGGVALFVNVHYQQRLVEQGCDVFIAGESDNYGFRFAAECGIPMIETSHELSENPGLRLFTEMLAEALPEIEFRFYENPCIWEIV